MTKISSVTVLSSFPPIKGITAYTLAFVQELEKQVKVDVLSFKAIYPEFLYPGGTKDKTLKKPELKNTKVHQFITWYNPISWFRAGFRVKGDIFHVQWWSWALAPMYLVILGIAKLRGRNIVMTIHNVLPHEKSALKNFLTRLVFRLADRVIVHTKKNKDDLKKVLGKTPIQVIPHGILSVTRSDLSKSEARESLGLEVGRKVLLFFGNIREYKGLDILLFALEKLEENYELIIAGQCWEDWHRYQEIIDHHGLGERILRLDGFIPADKVARIFQVSDLLILPYKSFDAGSGVGAMGLHFGTPTITSNIDGLSDTAIGKEFVFNVGDPEDLAKRIEWFYSQNHSFSDQIERIRKKFMWDDIVRKTLEFYEQ